MNEIHKFNPLSNQFCPLLEAENNNVKGIMKVREMFNIAKARAEYEDEQLRGMYVEDIRFNLTAPFIVVEFGYTGSSIVHDKVVICFEDGRWKVDDAGLGHKWLDALVDSDTFNRKFKQAIRDIL